MNGDLILPLYFNNKNRITKRNQIKCHLIMIIILALFPVFILYSNNSLNPANLFLPRMIQDRVKFRQSYIKTPVIKLSSPIDRVDKMTMTKMDIENVKRREKIKEMTLFAWSMYEKYAWAQTQLKPISKTVESGMFGKSNTLGATIVDALDTLYLMDLKETYQKGRDWVEKHFDINVDYDISAFEVNIRFVGGFLAMYALTNDTLYLNKAITVVDALLPVFETQTGLPVGLVNPFKKQSNVWHWVPSQCSLLTEVDTYSLEFEYLLDLTGFKKYSEKVQKIHVSGLTRQYFQDFMIF